MLDFRGVLSWKHTKHKPLPTGNKKGIPLISGKLPKMCALGLCLNMLPLFVDSRLFIHDPLIHMVLSVGFCQNGYIENGCFTKHPLDNRCLL